MSGATRRRIGTVYLVGAGPGDPGLLTRRGAALLRRAGVVVHDALVDARLLTLAPRHADRIDVGKRAGGHQTPQSVIDRLLVDAAARARVVVRLKGGDPFVFGRGGEEAIALSEAGVPFEVVPGVTAALGAAAYAGIPLTHRRVASQVTFMTGHEDPAHESSRIDWEHVAGGSGTLVIYMGLQNLRALAERLVRCGRAADTPAAVVGSATGPTERVVTAPLAQIADAAEHAQIAAPALIIVGDVVTLRERLEWRMGSPRGAQGVPRAKPSRCV
jgi:uroporphyrinogen III methyltransferase/synthase